MSSSPEADRSSKDRTTPAAETPRTLDVAIVGTGANPDKPSVNGFAMGYSHAAAYQQLENASLVACADLVRENAEAFADAHDLGSEGVFEQYEAMLDAHEPDLVSICVPPAAHADLVTGCASHGAVEAIHCEKPMAATWGGATQMVDACDAHDVRLTFNHQRRFGDPFRTAKALIDEGRIGALERIEYTWGDFYDNGTHAIDLCNYFNDEQRAEWVIAQLDYRETDVRFGAHSENQMMALWEYENGVFGSAKTGVGSQSSRGDWHLRGSDGELEVHLEERMVRVRDADAADWETYQASGEESFLEDALEHVVETVVTDTESELVGENALNATEIIFAGYESVRRRGRVDLPLDIDDNPLEAMVASGELTPTDPGEQPGAAVSDD